MSAYELQIFSDYIYDQKSAPDKIDLNFVSTKETSLFKKEEVIYNFEQGKTPKEISNIVKLDYGCVCRILRKLRE